MWNIFDEFEKLFGGSTNPPEKPLEEEDLTGKRIHVNGKLYRIEIRLRTIPVCYYLINVNDENDCIIRELNKKK